MTTREQILLPGTRFPDKFSVTEGRMTYKKGKYLPVSHMNMVMEQAVEIKIYHYLIEVNFTCDKENRITSK